MFTVDTPVITIHLDTYLLHGHAYPHILVPKVFGQINKMCRLVKHLIIHPSKWFPHKNMQIAKQLDY